MTNLFKYFLYFMLLWCLSGCTFRQEKVNEVLQSHGATQMHRDYQHIIELLTTYKEKLDARNPSSYSKGQQNYIYHELKYSKNTIRIKQNTTYLKTYDDYLRIAFDKNTNILDRNDYLIIGLYKLIWDTYEVDKGHQITTLSYHQDEFKRLYYYLEVIKWKIKTAKDKNGNYLFLTWQNNWQVELAQKMKMGMKPSWEMLENLSFIKNQKETILDPSNFNFEILLNQMIFHVKNSAKIIGDEPLDIGIDAMISLVLFL